jgi:anti-sigma B factor antagonist
MDIQRQLTGNNIVVVRLVGRLDGLSSPQVKESLHRALDGESPRLIVDLEGVPFIDSTGLVALVSGLRYAKEKEGRIVLCSAQPQAELVFRLTMLDRAFSIYRSVQDATQSFG